jgi:hypothetical protein
MRDPDQIPTWLQPVRHWTFSGSPTTISTSDVSSGETPKPETTSTSTQDTRETEIATWIQAMVALVPATITLAVSFGIDISGEQQLAMTGLVGAISTCVLITWRTFRKHHHDH